ncbi:flagellin domain protein [Exiguobacterium sibiricum 255-15]|uniref:Flagellin n=1 Tax=Exiguobacterium sibiricum (strain DSM 17290 / CCUG 55495 / CIP 109462 / JCM 13490 / 255-15) TaxID=262543 RepID=B1YLI8_EXIS2|nr:flagellin [Exiguobacterium sibiricum]ACB61893.1 flagellin domain protein [Exiguobacterium sibiricum 255-15]
MIINHNITALNTHNKLSAATAAQGKSMEKLASGLRINKAGDDAAGLAISEKMRGQVRGLDQASRNAQDGISMIQTAEGALNETHDILQRMRELSVQASNGTNNTEDLAAIKAEGDELVTEIDRIASSTKFNGKDLISSAAVDVDLQIGANDVASAAYEKLTLKLSSTKADTTTLLGATTLDVSAGGASTAKIDTAIGKVSTARSYLGANQNRLEHTINNLKTSSENLTAAESRIRDVDMAKEMMNQTKNSILGQAAQAMLAQSNQTPQGVLQLLR